MKQRPVKRVFLPNMDMLLKKHWALLDVEFIQSTKNHKCLRKMYILAKDGFTDWELEFYPCKKFKDLDIKYRKSFCYCRAHIHLLPYYLKR